MKYNGGHIREFLDLTNMTSWGWANSKIQQKLFGGQTTELLEMVLLQNATKGVCLILEPHIQAGPVVFIVTMKW